MKKSILISLILLFFAGLSITSVSAKNKICETCGKVIVDSYKEYQGQPYCSQKCLEAALPKCSVCGRSVGDGKSQGEFFRVKDRIFCSEKCLHSSLPKCSFCGKPAQKQIRAAGDTENIYCSPECYQTTLPKCQICGKSLEKWVEVNHRKYCSSCAKLPRCFNCRVSGADQKLADGRHICSPCMKTAIVDRGQAEIIFWQVRNDIYKNLNLITKHQIQFHLINADSLAAISGHPSNTEQGFYNYRARYRTLNGVQSLESETYAIYLLSALSPLYFRNAAAHELAHDIGQALYPNVHKKEDAEGFAEYIASLMNSYWGNDRLNREKLQNQERDYAQAYQKFLKIAQKNGLAEVMAYMEKQNQPPALKDIKKKTK